MVQVIHRVADVVGATAFIVGLVTVVGCVVVGRVRRSVSAIPVLFVGSAVVCFGIANMGATWVVGSFVYSVAPSDLAGGWFFLVLGSIATVILARFSMRLILARGWRDNRHAVVKILRPFFEPTPSEDSSA